MKLAFLTAAAAPALFSIASSLAPVAAPAPRPSAPIATFDLGCTDCDPGGSSVAVQLDPHGTPDPNIIIVPPALGTDDYVLVEGECDPYPACPQSDRCLFGFTVRAVDANGNPVSTAVTHALFDDDGRLQGQVKYGSTSPSSGYFGWVDGLDCGTLESESSEVKVRVNGLLLTADIWCDPCDGEVAE